MAVGIRQHAIGFALALFCLLSGLVLAWQHPSWPTVALALFYVWVVVAIWRPQAWLFVVPACLPFLNFWPWTGWQAFDEYDLLLLGALAGGYAHRVFRGRTDQLAYVNQRRGTFSWGHAWGQTWSYSGLLFALALATAVSLWLGLSSAGWFDDQIETSFAASQALTYESVWNVFRIAKSLVFALLLAPLLVSALQTDASRQRGQKLFGSGMLVGLAVVTLVALWERAAYPGWLEFSTRYRTTALFWEMHVGGAAIDAYLVIATPFLAWVLASTRRPAMWAGLALLAILTCYAVLTTFSRGVYLAVMIPLVLLASSEFSAWWRKRGFNLRRVTAGAAARIKGFGWRARAGLILAVLLASEVMGVVFGGTFLAERVASAQEDLDGRVAHWRRGISLLETPLDWAFGIGLGRFPALYAQISPETEFSGSIRLEQDTPRTAQPSTLPGVQPGAQPDQLQPASVQYVKLLGPQSNAELGGLFSLTQRVDFSKISAYTVNLLARAETEADLRVKVCEKHLIYEANCHYRYLKIRPTPDGQWQTLTIPLRGRSEAATDGPVATGTLPRFGIFSMSLLNAGGALALQQVSLIGPGAREILQKIGRAHV